MIFAYSSSVKEYTSLLVFLPGFCVAMTVTSRLSARHCALNPSEITAQSGIFFIRQLPKEENANVLEGKTCHTDVDG